MLNHLHSQIYDIFLSTNYTNLHEIYLTEGNFTNYHRIFCFDQQQDT